MSDFDDEYFDEQPQEHKHREGFCGAISTVMKRPARKSFATMDDLLE